jgi:hypothetical protein
MAAYIDSYIFDFTLLYFILFYLFYFILFHLFYFILFYLCYFMFMLNMHTFHATQKKRKAKRKENSFCHCFWQSGGWGKGVK